MIIIIIFTKVLFHFAWHKEVRPKSIYWRLHYLTEVIDATQ